MLANKNEKINYYSYGSIRRSEDESLSLQCLIDPESRTGYPILWEFSKNDHSFVKLQNEDEGVKIKGDKIEIDHVKKIHRGYYRCTLNKVSFTVLLRVKDRLAALWPFIGIVCVVLILVIIIIIFEKRQKSNKKPNATDDDEQDQANDPLVRTSIKTSDNENKKRAVKA